MAAGLLAVLFAFGVFAPMGAEAGVKGDPGVNVKITKDGVETRKPDTTGATIEVTFELSDPVDGAEGNSPHFDDVTINFSALIPEEFTFDADDIKVTQSGRNVGKFVVRGATNITTAADLQITYGASTSADDNNGPFNGSEDSGNGIVRANSLVTVTMTEVTLGAASETGHNVVVTQTASSQTETVAIGPTITSSSITLSDYSASSADDDADDTTNMADDAGENVTMTIKLTPDTANGGPNPDVNVVITLPEGDAFDLFEDVASPGDLGAMVSVSPTSVNDVVAEVATGDTITLDNFDANEEITITITGFTNPTTSTMYTVKLKQGNVAGDDGVSLPVHVTSESEIEVKEFDISEIDAGTEDVTLSFNFKAVIGGDDDPPIVIDLHDDFVLGGEDDYVLGTEATEEEDDEDATPGDFILYQMDGEDRVYVYGELSSDDTDRNDVSITLRETTDVEKWDTATKARGTVYVEVRGLTNPTMVARSITLVTITQGNFGSVSYSARLTGTEVSSNVAGSPVRLSISTEATADIPPGDDIEVNLKGFVVPESIAAHQILINGGDTVPGYSGEPFYGNPVAVAISKTKVTLTIPVSNPDGSRVAADRGIQEGGIYTITFKLGAGIKNPNVKAGDRSPSASGQTTGADNTAVLSKVSSASGSRGDLVTFSVVGLKSGSATIYLMQGGCIDVEDDCVDVDNDGDPQDDDFRIGGGLQVDGKVEVERRVTSSLFQANMGGEGPSELNAKGDGLLGTNVIYSVDGTGVLSDINGRFTMLPTVEVAPDSIKQGGLLELEISDWYYGPITQVEVGGVLVTEDVDRNGEAVDSTRSQAVGGDGETDFILVMPPGVRLGRAAVEANGQRRLRNWPQVAVVDSYSTKIEVDASGPGDHFVLRPAMTGCLRWWSIRSSPSPVAVSPKRTTHMHRLR